MMAQAAVSGSSGGGGAATIPNGRRSRGSAAIQAPDTGDGGSNTHVRGNGRGSKGLPSLQSRRPALAAVAAAAEARAKMHEEEKGTMTCSNLLPRTEGAGSEVMVAPQGLDPFLGKKRGPGRLCGGPIHKRRGGINAIRIG